MALYRRKNFPQCSPDSPVPGQCTWMSILLKKKNSFFFFKLRHGSHIGVPNNNKIVNGLNPGVIIIIMTLTTNKQLLDEVEHDIMNYQNRGLCYLPKPKAEADNTDTRF